MERLSRWEAEERVRRAQGAWRVGRGIPFPLRSEILEGVEIVEPVEEPISEADWAAGVRPVGWDAELEAVYQAEERKLLEQEERWERSPEGQRYLDAQHRNERRGEEGR